MDVASKRAFALGIGEGFVSLTHTYVAGCVKLAMESMITTTTGFAN